LSGYKNKGNLSMRLIMTNLLIAAMLAFSAASAGAITLTMGSNVPVGGSLSPGDQLIVTVSLDVEGFTGITLLSTGVVFSDAFSSGRLTYNQGASTTTSYTLYNPNTAAKGQPANGEFLTAASTCGGYPNGGTGCDFWVGVMDQVNVDFISTDLAAGTSQPTGATAGQGTTSGGVLATLIFDVPLDATDGAFNIGISITAPGNVIGIPGGGTTTATLAGGGEFFVPEPGLASLSLAALLTLTGLRTRARRKQL
jgi:hypothetical protein